MATIVLADDHHVVRQSLRLLLESEPDFHILAEASDGLEAVAEVERLQPEVLVLDMVMPGLSGIEVTRRTATCSPRTQVVILSMYQNEAYVLEALRAGARAYVLKSSKSEELVHAVREAACGRRYLSAPVSERIISDYIDRVESFILDPYEALTTREREVLHLSAEGLSNAEIATRLSISQRTAETHRANFMRKIGLRNQTDVIRYALRRGIIQPEH